MAWAMLLSFADNFCSIDCVGSSAAGTSVTTSCPRRNLSDPDAAHLITRSVRRQDFRDEMIFLIALYAERFHSASASALCSLDGS